MPEDWSTAHSPLSTIFGSSDRTSPDKMEMVMSNFQRLLESPFHWAADVAGGFLKRSRGTQRSRRERMARRDHLNG